MFPTSPSVFVCSSPTELTIWGFDEPAVGQLELRGRRVGQCNHSTRGPLPERAVRGAGTRTASRLLAFLESGATARLPDLVCTLVDTCVGVQIMASGTAHMLRESI
jgi:hypothetical protein